MVSPFDPPPRLRLRRTRVRRSATRYGGQGPASILCRSRNGSTQSNARAAWRAAATRPVLSRPTFLHPFWIRVVTTSASTRRSRPYWHAEHPRRGGTPAEPDLVRVDPHRDPSIPILRQHLHAPSCSGGLLLLLPPRSCRFRPARSGTQMRRKPVLSCPEVCVPDANSFCEVDLLSHTASSFWQCSRGWPRVRRVRLVSRTGAFIYSMRSRPRPAAISTPTHRGVPGLSPRPSLSAVIETFRRDTPPAIWRLGVPPCLARDFSAWF